MLRTHSSIYDLPFISNNVSLICFPDYFCMLNKYCVMIFIRLSYLLFTHSIVETPIIITEYESCGTYFYSASTSSRELFGMSFRVVRVIPH